ncbi:MAG: 30S ribosomal protein S5 [Candidatus Wildermuthbacteria bacterium]|nr:30S ribosomal protein S5 [Candidatus Wildermuthbacteria bacterium]
MRDRPSYQRRQPKDDFDSKVIEIARVTRVAAGGKHMSFRAAVIGGDRKGKVGIGIGKGSDVAQAIEKATRQMKKRLISVPVENETIPHEVRAQFGPSHVILKPQVKGRGLVAGGPVRIICQMAGIKNISGKFVSSTHNKINNAMAVIAALQKLKIHAAARIESDAQKA